MARASDSVSFPFVSTFSNTIHEESHQIPCRDLAALRRLPLGAQAQPAVKILVVDMAKLYDTHYKTVEQNAKIQGDEQKAQEEVEKMNKEGNSLVEEYKTLNDQSNNPALSAEAKAKAQDGVAEEAASRSRRKQREVQTFHPEHAQFARSAH